MPSNEVLDRLRAALSDVPDNVIECTVNLVHGTVCIPQTAVVRCRVVYHSGRVDDARVCLHCDVLGFGSKDAEIAAAVVDKPNLHYSSKGVSGRLMALVEPSDPIPADGSEIVIDLNRKGSRDA